MSVDTVLNYWRALLRAVPVDWNSEQSIDAFRQAADRYAKTWGRLSMADQGEVCHRIGAQEEEEG
jgi:acyl-CoA reductase-like NAD-dependent aldehyde dehydrogenase